MCTRGRDPASSSHPGTKHLASLCPNSFAQTQQVTLNWYPMQRYPCDFGETGFRGVRISPGSFARTVQTHGSNNGRRCVLSCTRKIATAACDTCLPGRFSAIQCGLDTSMCNMWNPLFSLRTLRCLTSLCQRETLLGSFVSSCIGDENRLPRLRILVFSPVSAVSRCSSFGELVWGGKQLGNMFVPSNRSRPRSGTISSSSSLAGKLSLCCQSSETSSQFSFQVFVSSGRTPLAPSSCRVIVRGCAARPLDACYASAWKRDVGRHRPRRNVHRASDRFFS